MQPDQNGVFLYFDLMTNEINHFFQTESFFVLSYLKVKIKIEKLN